LDNLVYLGSPTRKLLGFQTAAKKLRPVEMRVLDHVAAPQQASVKAFWLNCFRPSDYRLASWACYTRASSVGDDLSRRGEASRLDEQLQGVSAIVEDQVPMPIASL
jgi:hypothetical protein